MLGEFEYLLITAAAGLGDEAYGAAIREQIGSTVKRLHRSGATENIGAKRASKWKLAGA